MAKSADARDLKSLIRQRVCGFKSHPGHHPSGLGDKGLQNYPLSPTKTYGGGCNFVRQGRDSHAVLVLAATVRPDSNRARAGAQGFCCLGIFETNWRASSSASSPVAAISLGRRSKSSRKRTPSTCSPISQRWSKLRGSGGVGARLVTSRVSAAIVHVNSPEEVCSARSAAAKRCASAVSCGAEVLLR